MKTPLYNEKDFSSNLELLEDDLKKQIEDKINKNDFSDIESKHGKLSIMKGIEVGHIFELGNKYSESMGLSVQYNNVQKILEMGCYGIGVSRIVAATIEQNHDDQGIIFPRSISPFDCSLISINENKSNKVKEKSLEIYNLFITNNIEVFYDDRDVSPGVKFSDANLMGNPYQIVISEGNIQENLIEVIDRRDQSKSKIIETELLGLF